MSSQVLQLQLARMAAAESGLSVLGKDRTEQRREEITADHVRALLARPPTVRAES